MKRKQVLFRGCGTALVTPFTKDDVDFSALDQLLDAQLAGGVDALIACGTTGEPSTMSDDEQLQVVRHILRRVNGRLPVIAGVGGNHTAHCVLACKQMRDAGANGLLAVTPYYNKTTQAGLIAHYTALADATTLPLILYNVPSRTGLNLLPETLDRLADHPQITAIKEASGDISQITEMMRRCADRISFYSGNDDHVLPLLALGAEGVISVASNLIPAQMHALVSSYFAGDIAHARALQFAINPLARALFLEVNPIPIKTALRLCGIPVGSVRLPLVEMQPDTLQKLSVTLHDMHLM
ncbi:MAG: 4-hydroxy-tetrahydrodipicolinate synthase [Clostridia bacterium]